MLPRQRPRADPPQPLVLLCSYWIACASPGTCSVWWTLRPGPWESGVLPPLGQGAKGFLGAEGRTAWKFLFSTQGVLYSCGCMGFIILKGFLEQRLGVGPLGIHYFKIEVLLMVFFILNGCAVCAWDGSRVDLLEQPRFYNRIDEQKKKFLLAMLINYM